MSTESRRLWLYSSPSDKQPAVSLPITTIGDHAPRNLRSVEQNRHEPAEVAKFSARKFGILRCQMQGTQSEWAIIALAVAVLFCTANCGPASGAGKPLVLKSPGPTKATYVKYLSCSATGKSNLAVAWVDYTRRTSRLWVCEVQQDTDKRFRINAEPTLIDDGVIREACIIANEGQYGVTYVKGNQLLYRWPIANPPRELTSRTEERVMASSAIVTARGNLLILALMKRLHGIDPPTTELVAYRAGTQISSVSLLTIARDPEAERLPPPMLRLAGDIEVGILLNRGSVISAKGIANLPTLGNAGEFIRLTLSEELVLVNLQRRALPTDMDVRYARCFAPVDSAMATIVAGMPQPKIVVLNDSLWLPTRLSSPVGVGTIFAVPTVQSIAINESSATVAWIDTDRQFDPTTAMKSSMDPTGSGGDIHARVVTKSGLVVPGPVLGFPIVTRAQCFCLTQIGSANVVVWAGIGNTGIRIATVSPSQ